MDISLIPESAPFTTEQRAWLNGFLAGWLGLQGHAAATALGSMPLAAPPAPVVEDEPWHNPSLSLEKRLELTDGKPFENRLMAAMAQLDCGTCGYLCRTYSQAIAAGTETSLTLCSPGGSETAKTIKRLLKERPAVNGNGNGHGTNGKAANGVAAPVANGWSRKNPFSAKILQSVNLNHPDSEKETRHVEIDLAGGPSYDVGDSLGVYPENCEALVDELIAALGVKGDEQVPAEAGDTTLRDALMRDCCLTEVGDDLLAVLADSAEAGESVQIRTLIDDNSTIEGLDVLDVLRRFPSTRPRPVAFATALAKLRPRLYSISSSPKRHAGQVHLTVRRVSYENNGRTRKGVASTMLADRVEAGSPVRVFVQKAHGFSLPSDPNAAMIMIGPGTGIAPFRAFLHERKAIGAPGKNWLFFGDQRSKLDFLYEAELAEFLRSGLLTRLDTAFSRDQDAKVYVQDRMLERGAELSLWLEEGAYVYVCGDAKRMALDVDRALRAIVRDHGRVSEEAAAAYVEGLVSSGRYCRDVY